MNLVAHGPGGSANGTLIAEKKALSQSGRYVKKKIGRIPDRISRGTHGDLLEKSRDKFWKKYEKHGTFRNSCLQ